MLPQSGHNSETSSVSASQVRNLSESWGLVDGRCNSLTDPLTTKRHAPENADCMVTMLAGSGPEPNRPQVSLSSQLPVWRSASR